MASFLHCVITTPEGRLFAGEVEQLTLSTVAGQITILPNHIPLATLLKPGELLLKQGQDVTSYAVLGGFLEVQSDSRIFILADAAERPEMIDVAAAEAARARAQKTLQEKFDTADYEDAALQLERELARVRLARKYHRRHGQSRDKQ